MKTITGTSHFSSFFHARCYYGIEQEEVRRKIQNGEISVGEPEFKEGQTLYLNKEEGRYFIEG